MQIPSFLSDDLKIAIEAARVAGEVTMRGFKKTLTVQSKSGKGLVTDIDQKAEKVILDILRDKTPHSVLSEESGYKQGADCCWVIDPIDGTTNYSRKIGLFAISIALLEDQEIKSGVIYQPFSEKCYFAEKAKGAYLNGTEIKVSKNQNPESAILFINHGYARQARKQLVRLTDKLVYDYNLRTFGSTALELCAVAEGQADAYICSGDELWDYVAGLLLVQESGGRVTDWTGSKWQPKNDFILASNGYFHSKLVNQIKSLQP
jgi:myo-inositol-1(or 4)-monophosphatase